MKDDEIYDVAIIGAGASGLMAASRLAEKKIKTVLIEKNSKTGRKLLSTGAGKANLSNTDISPEFYLCDNKKKLSEIFKKTSPEDILNFLRYKLGVFTTVKEKGKTYPLSEKSENVSFAFENFLKNSSVSVKLLTLVTSVHYSKNIFEIKAKTLPHQFEKKGFVEKELIIKAKNLILSTGGPSYPKIGGTYSGFDIAKSLGHSINEIKPLITPLGVDLPNLSPLDGIRRNARVVVRVAGKETIIEDEVLFTDYGISGPLALELSFYYGKQERIENIFLDLFPEVNEEEFINFFNKRIDGSKSFKDIVFPSVEFGLAEFILKKLSIKADDKADIKGVERFVNEIKNLRLQGLTACGFDMAMSKAGGVSLDEIDEGFESKKMKNLFLTGEILDSGGKSGGYNLHFAFTGGYAAAGRIIERIYE